MCFPKSETTINYPDPPAPPDVAQTATEVSEARQTIDPQQAELAYNILSSPEYGLGPTTQQFEDVRTGVFPQETAVRENLTQNILRQLQQPSGLQDQDYISQLNQMQGQQFPQAESLQQALFSRILGDLTSPTGISPDQQASIDAIRERQLGGASEAVRTQRNLGGTLFGGRTGRAEQRVGQEMRQGFAAEDVAREERTRGQALSQAGGLLASLQQQQEGQMTRAERERLNAIQGAIPLLQVLYPQVGITSPQFQSAVPSPNTALQTQQAYGANNYGIQSGIAQTQAAANAQRQSSLLQALGGTAGGLMSGIGAGIAVSSRLYKDNIKSSEIDSIQVLKDTDIVEYNYKPEISTSENRIGIIAEDVPEILATNDRKAFDMANAVGILLDVNKKLIDRVERLEKKE